MWPPTGLIPWFSKTEGNTYATLLHHPFLFKGKPTQCSRGSSVAESKREEFCNLKEVSMSVYQYNIQFQKLARFARQDVPNEKSMNYHFRGGLKEEEKTMNMI